MKEMFKEFKPLVDFIYGLIEEVEQKDLELADVRAIARKQVERVNAQAELVQKLKNENNAMQLFIEENVPEGLKKEIFKD